MKTNSFRILLLAMFITGWGGQAIEKSYAISDYVLIDNIRYFIEDTYNRATVVPLKNGYYKGDITIPENVEYQGKTYTVQHVGEEAFMSSDITKINIPASVTNIGMRSFNDCKFLKTIIFEDGEEFLSIGEYADWWDGGELTFLQNTNIENLYIGRDLYNDEYSTSSIFQNIASTLTTLKISCNNYCDFRNCTALKNVELSEKLTYLAPKMFMGCTELKEIKIPNSVTHIFNDAFSGCTSLASITIPGNVKSIYDRAFSGCSLLKSVRIPQSCESLGVEVFKDCSALEEVIFLNSRITIGKQGNRNWIVYAYESTILDYFRNQSKTVTISNPYYVIDSYDFLTHHSLSFKLKEIYHEEDKGTLSEVLFDDQVISPDKKGEYLLDGLQYDFNDYSIKLFVNTKYEQEALLFWEQLPLFPKISSTLHLNEIHQERVEREYSIKNYYSQTKPKIIGFEIVVENNLVNYETTKFTINNSEYRCNLTFSNLSPKHEYRGRLYVIWDDETKEYWTSYSVFNTRGLNPQIEIGAVSPTSLQCKGSFTIDDATIDSTYFDIDGNIYSGNSPLIIGLEPNKTYDIMYYVTTKKGSIEEKSVKFTTPALEFNMLTPKVVNSTTAVVCAETNISDDETGAGFEWRKVDAPDVVPSKSGAGRVYDGTLEGRLNNLSSDSYYKVRPFYTSAAGRIYYGEWIGFDPSDFSYFEPTVHTYPVTGMTHNSARLKGYVMAGTDDIEEQGFQYWPANAERSQARYALATTTTAGDVTTVLASGQVMTAELNDLTPNTSYHYRAFVRTKGGTTYGEEQSFTTEADLTAVGGIEAESAEIIIIGYFDLKGRRYDMPQKGLNIVRYSDGTSRKLMVK